MIFSARTPFPLAVILGAISPGSYSSATAVFFFSSGAVTIPEVRIPQVPIIKGDTKSISIAAASIVAKVHRDRLMVEYDKQYPGYGFASNKVRDCFRGNLLIKLLALFLRQLFGIVNIQDITIFRTEENLHFRRWMTP